MLSLVFNYNVTRQYPIRWFPWVAVLGGILATAFLTVLNLAANGYELHNVYVTDPNATMSSENESWFERKPWSWMSRIATICQAQAITRGSREYLVPNVVTAAESNKEVYTSNHAFKYTNNAVSLDSGSIFSLAYLNDNLHDCKIYKLLLERERSSTSEMEISVSVITDCYIYNGSTPISVQLTAQDNFGLLSTFFPDDSSEVADSYGPRTSSSLKLSYTIATWCFTRLMSLNDFGWQGYWNVYKGTPVWGQVQFSDNNDERFKLATNISSPSAAEWIATFGRENIENMIDLAHLDDPLQFNDTDPHITTTIYLDVIAKVFYSWVLTDLGQPEESNVFASPQWTMDFMNQTNRLLLNGQDVYNQSLWNMVRGSYSDLPQKTPPADIAQFYQWLGVDLPQVNATTLSAQYLCQVPKLKSAVSLFISVAVSDFVFLQAIWTAFTWITAYFLERRHPDARYCDGCVKAISLGQLNFGTGSRPSVKIPSNDPSRHGSTAESRSPLVWSDDINRSSDAAIVMSAHSMGRRDC